MSTVADMNYSTITTPCGVEYNYVLPGETLSDSCDVRGETNSPHYFDDSAIRWFGMRNFETVARGVSVELQTKYPAGDGRYKVLAWSDDNGRPSPWFSCHHETRRQAVSCAKSVREMFTTV